ncbi:MAG: type II toxin-antitoxin system HicA family toxin [Sphingomonas sp.]|uniref:type II toxin-antitoxin system HicA family toxin n=1 Tax=Sphingomonas sp. TaxID=28214 RepID=UPI001855A386|nr:type II toxin-antitoxin system HicA family toxin [Sphingomonas sp.]MBA3666764.1 type II toxin-antitoxin system HicA family toxin [Sphingomonas sp.]
MAGFTKDVKRLLKDAGCYLHKQSKGDHEKWYSPISKRYFIIDGNIKSRHTANGTLEDAGLPKAF